jgi:hypothetical protein
VRARGSRRSYLGATTRRRPSRDAWLALCCCGPALAAIVLAPGPVALAAAVVTGVVLERFRQGHRERPLRLADTPAAWVESVRSSTGVRHAAAAGIAAVAALAVLLLPSLAPRPGSEQTLARTGGPAPPAKTTLPRIEILRRSPRRAFTSAGVSFRVFPMRPSAGGLQHHPGAGREWMSVGVEVRNLARRRFRPSSVAYRLKDDRGHAYSPDIGGGTGPASLARTGYLARDEIAYARLSFRIPRAAGSLSLIFEPDPSRPLQVQVPLRRSSATAEARR